MTEDVIACPKCGAEIPLSDALRSKVEGRLRKEYETLLAEESARSRAKAKEELAVEQADLEAELAEKRASLEASQKKELELLRKNRELEESKKTLDLEIEKQVQMEKTKIEEETSTRLVEEHRLRDVEKEKRLSDLRKQIEDLKRKAEQGSQQGQGEAAELNLEEFLRAAFPQDQIEPVPKGIRGADLVQNVVGAAGTVYGVIVWEVKNTKAWSDGWLEKLRDDQRELRAPLAAIVTTALPKGVRHFGQVEGVWVTDAAALPGLAAALRSQLVQVAAARAAARGRGTKMDLLYDYLTGNEFRQRIEAIVEAFVLMKGDLDRERRATETIWAKREKQINRALSGLAGMYGDMQGIVGTSLPKVTHLELGPGESAAVGDSEPDEAV